MGKPTDPSHFKGKTAVDHVVEAQARGIIASSELHGTEIPGSISAATDAARETTIYFLLLFIIFHQLALPWEQSLIPRKLASVPRPWSKNQIILICQKYKFL